MTRSCSDWLTLGQHLSLRDSILIDIDKKSRQVEASSKAIMAKLMVLNWFSSAYNKMPGGSENKLFMIRKALVTLDCKDNFHLVGKVFSNVHTNCIL